jgi:hypothetical protein
MKWYVLFIESKPCDDVYEETHLDCAPTIFKSMNTVQQMSLLTTREEKQNEKKKRRERETNEEYKRDLL